MRVKTTIENLDDAALTWVDLVDAVGPFIKLIDLKRNLENAPVGAKAHSMYPYLSGLVMGRELHEGANKGHESMGHPALTETLEKLESLIDQYGQDAIDRYEFQLQRGILDGRLMHERFGFRAD